LFGLVKIRLELFEQLESECFIDFIFRKEIINGQRRIEQRFVLEIKSFGLKNEWLIYAEVFYHYYFWQMVQNHDGFFGLLKLQVGFLYIVYYAITF
jgi:POT family proton-dependent oligopeptide transporter